MKWYLFAVAVAVLGFVALGLVVVPFFTREPTPGWGVVPLSTVPATAPRDTLAASSTTIVPVGEYTATSSTTTRTMATLPPSTPPKSPVLSIGTGRVTVDLARTPAEVERGLGGRESLGPREGMFFVFPRPDRYAFWMRDMRFSIDVVWLDEVLRVVDIKADTPPESYPATFAPSAPARYVLEVPAGYAAAHGIGIGTQASFEGVVPEGVLP